jgi:UrcA family protein
MTRIAIALAAAMVASSASAASLPAPEVMVSSAAAAHVSYDGLNLQSQEGRDQLVGRIHIAAAALCNDSNIDPLNVRLKRMECYRTAVADGVSQMNQIAN